MTDHSDDLVMRANNAAKIERDCVDCGGQEILASLLDELADRITQLEREKAELQSEVGFLTAFADAPDMETHKTTRDELRDELRTANTEADTLAMDVVKGADMLERLAFSISAPNEHTPQLVALAIELRKRALTIAQRRVNEE